MLRSIVVAIVLCLAAAEMEVEMLQADESPLCGLKKDGCAAGFWADVASSCICKKCKTADVSKSQWVSTPCSQTADAVVSPWKKCETETFQEKQGTANTDTQCKSCKLCKDGEMTQDKDCAEKADRTCKPCATCCTQAGCSKYLSAKCTPTVDTQCKDCDVCQDGKTFEEKPCSEQSNRECKDCTTCAQDEFMTEKCTIKKDTKCQKCKECPAGHYVKKPCGDQSDTECAPYQYAVFGKAPAPLKPDRFVKKECKSEQDCDIAWVRCVNDVVGISVCTSNTCSDKTCSNLNKSGENPECSKSWADRVDKANGSQGKAKKRETCHPSAGVDQMTLDDAKAFCEELGMRLPKTVSDWKKTVGTGCGINSKKIWYDNSPPSAAATAEAEAAEAREAAAKAASNTTLAYELS